MMSFESAGIPIAKSETGQRQEAVRNLCQRLTQYQLLVVVCG